MYRVRRKGKITRQPRIEGGRVHKGAGLDPRIADWVEREAARFNTTIPYVISVALSEFTGIKLKEHY